LKFSEISGVRKLLYLSSGSAYGKQPSQITQVSEDYSGGPMTTDQNFDHSVLGEGKRASELLCSIYSKKYRFDVCIARCFSFVGFGLPLNIHYAIGNFINDGLNGNQIFVKGNGTSVRSYLYIADLVKWLWTMLILGKSCEIYNVGSDKQISIFKLAKMIASLFDSKYSVKLANHDSKQLEKVDYYVPNINKARNELGLDIYTSLEDAIKMTIEYHKL